MNRYRTVPGIGPQRASANTVCQKCLKKGHYSYECKSGVQDRPYISRPSRTQQLLDPSLKPKLTDPGSDNLMRRDGVADEQLGTEPPKVPDRNDTSFSTNRSSRRDSTPPSDSVSTISTNRSRSQSRSRLRSDRASNMPAESYRASESRSKSREPHRKRKRGLSTSSGSRSPPRPTMSSDHKSRRYRSISPHSRGRTSSPLVESRQARSRTGSIDRSEVARHRRSFDVDQQSHDLGRLNSKRHDKTSDTRQRQGDSNMSSERIEKDRARRRRSLSPYSRRLALTQAMNMDR